MLLEAHYTFSVGDIELPTESDRAQPEAVTKVKLRGVAATRVRHWKEKPDGETVKNNCRSSGRNERDERVAFVWLLSRVPYENWERRALLRSRRKRACITTCDKFAGASRGRYARRFLFSGKNILEISLRTVANRMLRLSYGCFITFFPSRLSLWTSVTVCTGSAIKFRLFSSSPRGLITRLSTEGSLSVT